MAWCPKCKNEYVEGILTCADCGIELVDELPEEVDPNAPAHICDVDSEEIGTKLVTYLNYGGIQTAGLVPKESEDGTPFFQLLVANFEKDATEELFSRVGSVEEAKNKDISELIPDIEKEMESLEKEEADKMFSELRSEASSVYVKKKEKYNDLKFSGFSFIAMGVLGIAFMAANALGYINYFNTFSMIVMGVVFAIFLIIGITSLARANKLKAIVSEEDKVTEDVNAWIEENITDDYLDQLYDESLSDEDNYFNVHNKLCEKLYAEFSYLSPEFIDQLMDERYDKYCEK